MFTDFPSGSPAGTLGIELLTADGRKILAEVPEAALDLSGSTVQVSLAAQTIAALLADLEEAAGTGTAYTLTGTSAAVAFGTTSPSIVLGAAGTYLLLARVRVDHVGASYAANRTITVKLRRTNNTAADLANGSAQLQTGILTTVDQTAGNLTIFAIYTTALTDDAVTLYADVSTLPSAGASKVSQAHLVAVRLS